MDKIPYPNDKSDQMIHGDQVFGMFKTKSDVPSGMPTNWFDQIVIYKSGATLKLYIYDVTNAAWRSVTIA